MEIHPFDTLKRDTPKGLGSAKASVFIEAQGGLLLKKYTQGFEGEGLTITM